jgi:hypothetical protein
LDFDNFDISPEDFEQVADIIKLGLEREGFHTKIEQVYRGPFTVLKNFQICYIK